MHSTKCEKTIPTHTLFTQLKGSIVKIKYDNEETKIHIVSENGYEMYTPL
jgi:hypothetical protein